MCDFCSWVNRSTANEKADTTVVNEFKPPPKKDPVIVVHGGAGSIPEKIRLAMLEDVKTAATQAYTKLIRGSHVLDAVEDAICYLESRKYFNCAFGGSLDCNGDVVMDAAIMDSKNQFGSVGAIRDIEHPISLARLIMHNTDHILIVEKGAQDFALKSGIPILPKGWLIPGPTPSPSVCSETKPGSISEKQHDSRDEILAVKRLPQCSPYYGQIIEENSMDVIEPTFLEVGGVGTVAYDRRGRLATGTSTAGNPGKLYGYISPAATVPGCGIMADQTGCISISGPDEALYVYAPARGFLKRLNRGENVDEALDGEIDQLRDVIRQPNVGAIALDLNGKPAVSFKSQHFPWAYCELGWLYYGCQKNQILSEKIDGLDRPLDCMCEGVV
ncbi:isoaspartyl peptidase/L-asparaginase-like [Athalia rosae]|uniref:isoaspartyl peptidase/L-asparaginase-like n=1 Tax=Athalia rosae TaxID=37344 RepID=UPI0006266347|nr:isoaspartyl peptidase/L-asparaginase-like [Athalia rosae]